MPSDKRLKDPRGPIAGIGRFLMQIAGAALAQDLHAAPPELRSTLADQKAVAVTIYNRDLALVKDSRALTLPAGPTDLALRDVSARIRPETALLRRVGAGPMPSVVEQNFDFDLLTPDKLLEKYVGRQVGIVRAHPTTGEETEEAALVLSAANGLVLRMGDRIEAGTAESLPGRIVFRDIPPNLRDRPTLVLRLDVPQAGAQELERSYLTGGLSWQADYVGELAADEQSLDLTGWVTLSNRSGTAYRDARVQLVAGDVHRAPEPAPLPMGDFAVAMRAPEAAMQQEALFEYHLYSLPHRTTLADNQTKQVSLLSAPGVAVGKELVVHGGDDVFRYRDETIQKPDVQVLLQLRNNTASNLGLPLPAGVVRIYKRDSAGNAQFIGEDRIDHTPKNATLRLTLGNAFDVTAEKKQTDFAKRSGTGPWQYEFETAFEITVANAKPEPVTVTVRESIPGEWSMLQESAPHEKTSARTAEWRLDVPAEGETVLTYRVRVRL
jgi:hypothetical protein